MMEMWDGTRMTNEGIPAVDEDGNKDGAVPQIKAQNITGARKPAPSRCDARPSERRR